MVKGKDTIVNKWGFTEADITTLQEICETAYKKWLKANKYNNTLGDTSPLNLNFELDNRKMTFTIQERVAKNNDPSED